MSALAAAEHLVAASTAGPDSVDIQQSTHFPTGVLGVDLHFRRSPSAIAEFAAAMGVPVVQRTGEFGGAWFIETTATGALDAVPFYAWTRVPAPMPEVKHLSEKAVA